MHLKSSKINFISVACVVRKKNSYMFCQREDNGLWELPGGRIEEKETVQTAARRELFEETNIKADTINLRAGWFFNYLGKERPVAVVECANLQGKLKTSAETKKVAFLDPKERNVKVPYYARNLLNKLERESGFFILKAGPFESWVIVRYLFGRVKRMFRVYSHKYLTGD